MEHEDLQQRVDQELVRRAMQEAMQEGGALRTARGQDEPQQLTEPPPRRPEAAQEETRAQRAALSKYLTQNSAAAREGGGAYSRFRTDFEEASHATSCHVMPRHATL